MDNDSINTEDFVEILKSPDYTINCKEAKKKDFDKSAYNKQYYDKRKDLLKSSDCEVCYGTYNLYSRSTHMKSKKHLKALEKQTKK